MRMRLTRFYRAYPELNGYSDEACESMVWAARARRADAMWVVPLAAIVGVNAVVFLAAFVVTAMMARTLAPDALIRSVWMIALCVAGIIAACLWVGVRRVLIIRSVLNHMEKATCPYCRFSLRGLVLKMGGVVCPECGQRIMLADEGITPDDLKPRGAHRTWTPAATEPEELPPIPLEPAAPAGKKQAPIRTIRDAAAPLPPSGRRQE